MRHKRRICFVTGTRAEFGLMQATLRAIKQHPNLQLQLVVTGMHLSAAHGRSINLIRQAGWKIDAIAKWQGGQTKRATAIATGQAIATLAKTFGQLRPDVVLVVGDRVEAFAAAAAAHIAGLIVAHIHGGDRALGQIDDSLRHAISKLAHIHFPATADAGIRLLKLGEDQFRIHRVGSAVLDDIVSAAHKHPSPRDHALLVLHPTDADQLIEYRRAKMIYHAVRETGINNIVIIYPNNDPGSAGIIRCWRECQYDPGVRIFPNIERQKYLQLLGQAAILIGNSSSGIIEAASLGTPVLDIGPRQRGRLISGNVLHVSDNSSQIRRALAKLWNNGKPKRYRGPNVYGRGNASRKIADILASVAINQRLKTKLISY